VEKNYGLCASTFHACVCLDEREGEYVLIRVIVCEGACVYVCVKEGERERDIRNNILTGRSCKYPPNISLRICGESPPPSHVRSFNE